MRLRNYQREVIENVALLQMQGKIRQLIVLPCGTGKTVIAAHIPRRLDKRRVLFVVHRDELVWQTKDKFSAVNPDMPIEVEKAEFHSSRGLGEALVVASIQSLSRRLDKWPRDWPDLIIVDEAHHSVGSSYVKALEHFGAMKGRQPRSDCTLIGITATPRRADDLALGSVYDVIAYHRPLEWFIDSGYLVDIKAWRILTEVRLDDVRIVRGDFDLESLSRAVDTDYRNRLVVEKYLELTPGTLALAFTTTILHAKRLSDEFCKRGVPSAFVSGETPEPQRRRLFDMFRTGTVKVICSAGVLNEGLDLPMAQTAIMARPTHSGLLYTQQLGRVMRPWPPVEIESGERKQIAYVLDFVDNSSRLELASIPTLFGLPKSFDLKGGSARAASTEMEFLSLSLPRAHLEQATDIESARLIVESTDPLAKVEQAEEVKRFSKNLWIRSYDGSLRLPLSKSVLIVSQDMLGQWEVWRAENGVKTGPLSQQGTLKSAIEFADSLVPDSEAALTLRKVRWRSMPPTEKQCELLWKLNPKIRSTWKTWGDFYRHATQMYNHMDMSFSRGSMSQQIELWLSTGRRYGNTQ